MAAVEMKMKYPIMIESDRDIRSRAFVLCIANVEANVRSQEDRSIGGDQTPYVENAITCLKIPYEELGMFALNLVNNLASSGVQLPSLNGEVKRMEQLIKAQADEIVFLRAVAGRALEYHTSFGPPLEAVAEETRR